MSRIVISILNLYKSAVSWRGSCDLTRRQASSSASVVEHAMIPPISVFRANPDRSSAGGWAATPRRLISVAAAASVLSELGNVFQWRRSMRPGTEGFSWWRTCPCVSLGFSISLNPSQASLLVALTCCSSYWLKFAFYESAALFQTVSTGGQ